MRSSSINYFIEKARLLANRDFEPNVAEINELDLRMSVPFRTSMETKSAKKELERMQKVYKSDLKRIVAFGVDNGLTEDGLKAPTIEASEPDHTSSGAKRKRSSTEDEDIDTPEAKSQKFDGLGAWEHKHTTSIVSFTEQLNAISRRYNGPEGNILTPAGFKRNTVLQLKYQDAAKEAITKVENTRVEMKEYMHQREDRFSKKIHGIYRSWGFPSKGVDKRLRWKRPLQPKEPEKRQKFGKNNETSLEFIKRYVGNLPILQGALGYYDIRPKMRYLDAVASALESYTKAIQLELKKRTFTQEEIRRCKPQLRNSKKRAAVEKRKSQNREWLAWNDAKKAAVTAKEATDAQREIVRMVKTVHKALPDQMLPKGIGTPMSFPMRMRTRMGKDQLERKFCFTGNLIKSDLVSLERYSKRVGRSPLSNVVAGAAEIGE
ncbi:hypothetical protein VTL71DRAFT_14195 [Oculimacula yallundae]|uniref:Uncharacterized protein n=1 Tax=Oculimacula yallundae TaxID=86028 RepID=A0ABR4CJ49_9HELO